MKFTQNKLIYILIVLITIQIATALQGTTTSNSEIRFALGYITINSTNSSNNIQGFGDYISSLTNENNFIGWLSQLTFNFFKPSKPIIETPSNNSYYNFTPIFSWYNSTDPEELPLSYLFEIYNDSSLTEIHYTNYEIPETDNSTSLTPTIKGDNIYYWHVAANDTSLNSSFSDTRTITIDTLPPSMPNLTSPANNTESTDNTPTLEWQAPTEINIENYTIEFFPNNSLTAPTITLNTTATNYTEWISPNILTDGEWHWRVIATDKANNMNTSNASSYTLQALTDSTIVYQIETEQSGGSSKKQFTISIIEPPKITFYANDVVTIPLIIKNPTKAITLTAVKLTVNSDSKLVTPELDIDLIPSIEAGEQAKVNLRLITGSINPGVYGITITASVSSPAFQDTARIFANVIEKDAEEKDPVNKQLSFAKQLFSGNPECLDLSEFITQAETAITKGQYDKALSLAKAAITSCNELITLEKKQPKALTQLEKYKEKLLANKNILIIISEVLAFLIVLTVIIRHFRKKH